MEFLPITMEEVRKRGNKEVDFVVVTGDAYVDHHSFGPVIIARVLEDEGFVVGIIAQPNWNDIKSFDVFGKPKYAYLVSSGNIDSMVNHYTVAKKRRSKDFYSPGDKMDLRPDRATTVYSNKIRELYKDVPIILGGIEASLRRFGHYDYWSDSVRRSVLMDASADLLVYGMGERQSVEIGKCFRAGMNISEMTHIRGTVFKTKETSVLEKGEMYDKDCDKSIVISGKIETLKLPDFSEIKSSKTKFSNSFKEQFYNTDFITGKRLVEAYGNVFVVQNPPARPLDEKELDKVYNIKFVGKPHPIYDKEGGISAINEVKFSLASNRGCFGSCNFCALTFHQGRTVTSRSHKSLVKEATEMTFDPDFKGYIHDVGGPTANFRKASCKGQLEHGVCKDKMCLTPVPCKKLEYDHKDYLMLLKKLRDIPKIKKVFIRSGIRYDYLINDKNGDEFFKELCKNHVSGQLKVAPEHISDKVLAKMGKPTKDIFERFADKYHSINRNNGMNQFLVPYLMSSHPGSDLQAAIELAEYLRDNNIHPEQVQDFYPTPSTISTCVYYTGFDPMTGKAVYVAKTAKEKTMQRALIQYKLPQNYDIVKAALLQAGREDLIGFEPNCLIRPRAFGGSGSKNYGAKSGGYGGGKSSDSRGNGSSGYKGKKTEEARKPFKKKMIRNVHKKKK